MKVAVVGTGTVGSALAEGAAKAGHEVRLGSRRTGAGEPINDVLGWADVAILAIPGGAVDDFAATHAQQLGDRVVIDATNNMGGSSMSGVDTIRAAAPSAHVFRAFNSVGWENMTVADYDGVRPDLFFAGPDDDTRPVVAALIDSLGPRSVYVGASAQAHAAVNGLAGLWFALAFDQGRGRRIAFKLLED
jgi:8-hydroxy-5-deazaflavin:NADPH oxidoreductase